MVFIFAQLIEPYGASVMPDQKCELQENALEKSGSHRRSGSNGRNTSPEIDSKEIKNIYVDSKLGCLCCVICGE